jgi:hypothetical protein
MLVADPERPPPIPSARSVERVARDTTEHAGHDS